MEPDFFGGGVEFRRTFFWGHPYRGCLLDWSDPLRNFIAPVPGLAGPDATRVGTVDAIEAGAWAGSWSTELELRVVFKRQFIQRVPVTYNITYSG